VIYITLQNTKTIHGSQIQFSLLQKFLQMSVIRVKSCDEKEFVLPEKVAKMSKTLGDLLHQLGSQDKDEDAIPLSKISSEVLEKVVEWMIYHTENENVDEGQYFEENDGGKTAKIDEIYLWDREYVKRNYANIFDIIQAANYLDIKDLLKLACRRVAKMLQGKTPEEIRIMFNIQNDLTPAEEEQIRKENDWFIEK
jgi:S-phase kinase-associated protein 1